MRLDRGNAQLLVIDLQTKLLPAISGAEAVLARSARMIRAAKLLDLPITVTEQYPRGLGPTDSAVAELLSGSRPIEKVHFGCADDAECLRILAGHQRRQVLIVGIETHVCVLQTVLGLIEQGYEVFTCADAASSRDRADHQVAIERMQRGPGVVTTTESAIFELTRRAGTDLFKKMLDLVK